MRAYEWIYASNWCEQYKANVPLGRSVRESVASNAGHDVNWGPLGALLHSCLERSMTERDAWFERRREYHRIFG